ncbi:MAG TPA: SigB/SigF/SigG family RNA polymerase sigma factor [Bacillota bacterium]
MADADPAELWRRARAGDAQAREELIRRNLPLVHHVAGRFRSTGIEYEELVQIGSIGLVKAVDGFDPTRGVRFSTYAVPVITGEILRFLRDEGSVHISRSARELARRAHAAQERLAQMLGRQPALHELADELGVSPEQLLPALEASRRPLSLYETLANDDDDPLLLLDRLVTESDIADASTRRALLEDLLARLEPRERRIVVLRYFADLTQQEIAERVGLSQGQVSRLLQRALAAMRAWAGVDKPSSAGF